eukprot:jgi/Undpi1/6001/HiC_scaffold_2.g01275.m1
MEWHTADPFAKAKTKGGSALDGADGGLENDGADQVLASSFGSRSGSDSSLTSKSERNLFRMTDTLADRTFSFAPAGGTPPTSPPLDTASGLKQKMFSGFFHRASTGGEASLEASPIGPSSAPSQRQGQRNIFRPASLSSAALQERCVAEEERDRGGDGDES